MNNRTNRKSYTKGDECDIRFTSDIEQRKALRVAAQQNDREMGEEIYTRLEGSFHADKRLDEIPAIQAKLDLLIEMIDPKVT